MEKPILNFQINIKERIKPTETHKTQTAVNSEKPMKQPEHQRAFEVWSTNTEK